MPQRGFQAVSLEQALADAMAVRERREADRLRAEQEAEAARLEYERTRRRTKGEVAQDVGAQLLSGAVGLGQFAYGLSNMSTGGVLDRLVGLSDNFGQTQDIIHGWKSSPTQIRSEAASRTFEEEGFLAGARAYVTDPLLMQDLLVSNIPSLLPPGAVARGVGTVALRAATAPGSRLTATQIANLVNRRATRAAITTGALQSAGATNIDAINLARESGATELEAQMAGLGAGVISGVATPLISRATGSGRLEAELATRLFRGPAGREGASVVPQGVLRAIGSGAVRESVQEGAQSGAERMATNLFAPGVDVFEGVGQESALGSVSGGVFGSGMGAGVGISRRGGLRRRTPLREEAEQRVEESAAAAGYTPVRAFSGRPDLQAMLDEQLGITPRSGRMEAGDILSAEDIRAAEVQQRADAMFLDPDSGEYRYYDQDIQAFVPLTPEQALARAEGAMQASEGPPVRAVPGRQDLQAMLDEMMGIAPRPGQMGEGDLLTTESLRQAELQREADARYLDPDTGEYRYYDQDIQAFVPLTREQALVRAEADVQASAGPSVRAFRGRQDLQAMLDEQMGISPRPGQMGERDLLTTEGVRQAELQREADAQYLDPVTGEYRYYDQDIQAFVPLTQEQALALVSAPLPGAQVEYLDAEDITLEGVRPPQAQVEYLDVEDITLEGVRPPPAQVRQPLVPPEQLQEFIDQQMDTGRNLTRQELLTAEDIALETLFVVDQDEAGNPVYSRYNADLQRMEVVPAGTARKEAKAAVQKAQQPPTVGWKQRLSRDLGIPPQALRGEPWDRFLATVEQEGVRPDDPNAGEFLTRVASTLPRSDTETSRFAVRMAEQYAAPTDAEITQAREVAAEEAGEAQVDADVTPQAEAAAIQQVEAVEAPTVEQVAGEVIPGQVVPNVVPEGQPEVLDTQTNRTLVTLANRFVKDGEAATAQEGVAMAVSDGMYEDHIRTATDLDEYFSSVKNTASFRALPDDVQTRLAQEFSELFDQMESVGRFKRRAAETKVSKPLPRREFDSLVARANDTLPSDVRVIGYADAADYRRTTGRPAPDDIQGVYTDGTIHMIRANIADKSEFSLVLMHEQGHDGLRGLLGDRLPAVINRLFANAALRPRIEQKREQLGVDRITAGEEVLADMIAHGETLTGDVRSKVRNAIAQGAARIMGVGDLRVSDARVDELLRHTAAYIRGRHIHTGTSLADELANVTLDKIIGDPGSLKESARFSRNLSSLERQLASINSDTIRPSMTFDDALGQSTDHARKAMGAVASRSREGVQVAFRGMLHATPQYWMNRTYARMWQTETGNAMNDYANSVMAREAEGNRLINKAHTLTYEAPAEGGGTREVTMKASPHDIAKRWTKLHSSRRPQYEALNVVDRYSTLYRLWPDRSWDQQPVVDYSKEGFTEQERRQALGMIQTAWKRAGAEGQEIFRLAQGDYRRQWTTRFHALAEEYSRTTGIPRVLGDGTPNPEFQQRIGTLLDNALNRMRSGPYAPLSRYGNYYAVGYDADGNRVHASAYDTREEAERAASALRNERTAEGQAMTVGVSEVEQYLPTLDGINHGVLRTFEQGIENSLPSDIEPALRNDLLQGVREAYLQSVPGHSLMSHANQRKGIEGFGMDALRAYSDYTMKNTRSILAFNHDGNISRALARMADHVRELTRQGGNTVTHQQVLNAVRVQRDRYLKAESNPLADYIGQAGFMQYLSTPSQLFVNGMQTAMVAFPRLAGAFGGVRALGAIRRAMQSFVMSRGDLLGERSTIDPDVRSVLESLREDGTLAFTQTHDMLDLSRGDLQAMSGHWHTAKKIMGAFVHKSEVFNRQVTAAAAAELAMPQVRQEFGIAEGQRLSAEAVEALAHIAKQHTLDSNFVFSSSDKPGLLQGPYRKLLFQFQHYRFNMLAMIGRDIRDSFQGTPAEKQTARRTLAYLLGTQAALTGVTGTILAPIAFAIMDLFRDDDDLLDSRTEFLMHAPQFIAHGVLGGVLDMSRLDSGSLIPLLGDRAYAPTNATGREQVQYYAMRNLGPWLGLGADYAELANKMAEGKLVEGLQAGLPKIVRDPIAAVTGMSGVKDARDVVYFEPGIGTTVAQAVGLRSGARREAEDLRSARYKVAQNVSTLRGRYMGMAALGLSTGDDALVQEAYGKIQAWNERYPDLAITQSDVRRSITGRYRAQMLADLYGTTTQGHLSPSELKALNL